MRRKIKRNVFVGFLDSSVALLPQNDSEKGHYDIKKREAYASLVMLWKEISTEKNSYQKKKLFRKESLLKALQKRNSFEEKLSYCKS